MNFLKKLFDHEYKQLNRFEEIANQVMALDEEMSKLTDEQLKEKTVEFKERLKNESLDNLIVEAFAVAREAAYRVIGENHTMYKLLVV